MRVNDQKKLVYDFLKRNGMDNESFDLESDCRDFMREMSDGLEGKKSSLKMIPTYIALDKDIPLEEPVIVMDAGGTNFRVAAAYFGSEKKPVIEDYNVYPMPGSRGEISREEFFRTVAEYMKPVITRSKKIGFCFSYATEILPNKDGKLLQFSKEVRVRDMIGELIGENLINTLKEMGYPYDKKIVLLNDTVATLLGGKASYPDRVFDSYIGFILGTGTNTCYMEENSNIKKSPHIAAAEGSMIINIESGGYGKAHKSMIDIEFDNGTINPGEYTFEKMISGRYLGELFFTVVRKAALEGLFTDYFTCRIKSVDFITTREMNDFLHYPYAGNKLSECCQAGSDDHIILYYLIDSIIERAARLVTVNLASIMMKTGKGKNPCEPVCITADGSTFYKLKLFRSKLEYYIKKFLNEEQNLYCEFVKAENVTLIGTAIAGLLNE